MMSTQAELLLGTLEDLRDVELKRFQWFLQQDGTLHGFPPIRKCWLENTDRQDTVDRMMQTYGLDGALKITVEILKKVNRNDLVQCFSSFDSRPGVDVTYGGEVCENRATSSLHPQTACLPAPSSLSAQTKDLIVPRPWPPRLITSYQHTLQSNLENRFMCILEGSTKQKDKKLLYAIYTELYIVAGGGVDVNCQHEVRQIEAALRKQARMEKQVKPSDIFKHPSGKYTPIKTVLTNGIAGIGKTFLVYKFILDWAKGTANQDTHLMFPFTFRGLNPLKGKMYRLAELIYMCISETIDIEEEALNHIFTTLQKSGNSNYDKSIYKVTFVFDGLDESRLQLDFTSDKELCVDVAEPMTVDALVTNLIKGKLLPSARIWITTRPAAAGQIPSQFVDQVTEVRGFTDLQKEEYFRKRFSDENLASRIISHIKMSRSLHIMCHIPVFCWISATVLEDMLRADGGSEMPKTLTEMYTNFLVFQIKQTTLKYGTEKSIQCIRSLGKLAFHQLMKGNLVFCEKDLKKSGLCLNKASVHSGVFTQIFKEERGLTVDKMFCFVHLSIQEFLAAVYVVLSLVNKNKNVMAEQRSVFRSVRKIPSKKVYKKAVDRALQSTNGHLDLFLRFLLGLSLETNQSLLHGLLTQTGSSSQTNQETVEYIKEKIREKDSCSERSINLFHCLNELNDHSLVEEIQRYLHAGTLSETKLLPADWSALAFVLLTSEEELDVFDLRKYSASEEALLRLLPLVKASRTALLSQCELSDQCCDALASVLNSSTLRELDLSDNNLRDSGVKLISAGLGNPQCKLETLRLNNCGLTEACCHHLLTSTLNSPSSHLRELDLSFNDLQDSGVKHIFSGLGSSHCKLMTLRLNFCGLTEACCHELASTLNSPSSHLRELDLSDNDLQDSGVKLISSGLGSSHCKLMTLRLSGCMVTEAGCASLASALRSNPSHLRELDLSYNHPADMGEELLSAGLEDPHWRLETVNLDNGGPFRIKPGPRKYTCEITLDPNTANHSLLLLDGNKTVMLVREKQPYPDHPERFTISEQVLCKEGLTGRCYWEAEWRGLVGVGLAYRGIPRVGRRGNSHIGFNDKSWSLNCNGCTVWHNGKRTVTPIINTESRRVGVYLNWPGGTLSFYRVSSDRLSHQHTFHCRFTDPLYPAFWVFGLCTSVSLCQE